MMLMAQRNIQKARSYSDELLQKLRGKIASLSLPAGCSVVAVGSLARREASEQSDIDYFVISDDTCGSDVNERIGQAIASMGLRAPSVAGAFAKAVNSTEILEKIGGNNESNDDLTRRMLLLLESEWLHGEPEYDSLFSSVIERYIRDGITQH